MRIRTISTIWLCLLGIIHSAQATHVMGGDLSWQLVGKDSFKLTLTYYRDCNGTRQDSAYIDFKSSCHTERKLARLVSKTDITPLCDNSCSRCSNSSCSFKYGVEKIELATIFTTTEFIKNGCCEIQIVWEQCCRNTPSPPLGNSNLYLQALMNTCLSRSNNSPVFDDEPITFLCIDTDQILSFGVSDRDHDSIRYALSPPLVDSATGFSYSGGYSYQSPIYYKGFPKSGSKFPEGFHLNKKTGTIMFRPVKVEQAFMAVKVTEYKNGKVLSEITRDLQLVVLKCPSNNPPVLSGIKCSNPKPENFEIKACPNTLVSFDICTSDTDKDDTVTLEWINDIPGAKINLLNAGDKREKITFSWKPQAEDYRAEPYSFTVIATDNACPMVGKTSRTYYIQVEKPGPSLAIDSLAINCGEISLTASTKDTSQSSKFLWNFGTKQLTTGSGSSSHIKLTTKLSGMVPFSVATTGANGCTQNYYDTLLIPKHLTIQTIADTSVCFGDEFPIIATTTNYNSCCSQAIQWSTGHTASGVSDTLYFGPVNRDTSLWVAASDGLCSDTDWVAIKMRYPPTIDLPATKYICPGLHDTLKPKLWPDTTNSHPLGFYWHRNRDPAIISRDSMLPISAAGMYFLTVKDELGCGLTDSTQALTDKTWSMNDTFVCAGDSLHIDLAKQAGTNYHWKDNASDSTTTFVGNFRIIIPTQKTAYRVERIKNSGGFTCRITDTFLVDVAPVPIINAKPDTLYSCPGNRVVFTANKAGGVWQGPGVFSNSQKLNFITDSINTGQNIIIYRYTNSQGCTGFDSSILYIWRQPKSRIKPGDTVVQLGSTHSFSNAGYSGVNPQYVWTNSLPANSGTNDSFNLTFNQLGISHLQLIVTDDLTGCGDTSTLTIHIEKSVWDGKQQDQKPEIYPNPGSGMVQIDHVATTSQLQVISISGAVVCSKTLHPGFNSIDMSHLPEGVYLYRIANPSAESKGKLVIVR